MPRLAAEPCTSEAYLDAILHVRDLLAEVCPVARQRVLEYEDWAALAGNHWAARLVAGWEKECAQRARFRPPAKLDRAVAAGRISATVGLVRHLGQVRQILEGGSA